jgi:hypothetical protein
MYWRDSVQSGPLRRTRGVIGLSRIPVRYQLSFHSHQPTQLIATTRNARAHGADWNLENGGDFLVTHAFKTNEQDNLALLRLQLAHRDLKVAQFQCRYHIGSYRKYLGDFLDGGMDAFLR